MYMSPRRYMPQKAYVGPRRLMYVYEPTHGPQKAYVHIRQYVYGPNMYIRMYTRLECVCKALKKLSEAQRGPERPR